MKGEKLNGITWSRALDVLARTSERAHVGAPAALQPEVSAFSPTWLRNALTPLHLPSASNFAKQHLNELTVIARTVPSSSRRNGLHYSGVYYTRNRRRVAHGFTILTYMFITICTMLPLIYTH